MILSAEPGVRNNIRGLLATDGALWCIGEMYYALTGTRALHSLERS
jgi:hypothetical protein